MTIARGPPVTVSSPFQLAFVNGEDQLRIVPRSGLGVLREPSALPAIIKSFRKMLADKRGEVAAEVTAAHALTDAQQTFRSGLAPRTVRPLPVNSSSVTSV